MKKLSTLSPLIFSLLVSFGSVPAAWAQEKKNARALAFTTAPQVKPDYLRSTTNNAYLTQLRTTYGLDRLVAGKKTDFERVQAVCAWARKQWEHNGSNTPLKSDPISILEEAATGKQFRCVEYGVVVSGALNSLGIPARTLALKMEHADTIQYGAGHVVAEAYLHDQKKWVLVDGQFDVIPTLKGKPLNAVEMQQALAAGAPDLQVVSFSGTQANDYFQWIAPYLFYFDTRLDNRYGVEQKPGSIMLMPQGAQKITVFQRIRPLTDFTYTHSVADFYPTLKKAR
ncbi:transglutaminase-like domain-containing protein [Rufibacter psychrotolerans]|uniref:transglutaminase-like domain-containing protein n=1 Tax=Rufibacter psychrotolerans TaxID=2812556 RepID=UPI001966F41D|nr:transglutaminase-like domain-containing protein [Rufibacter sp. SYSU D00308]